MTERPYWVDFQATHGWPSGRVGTYASATAGYVHVFTNGDVGYGSFNLPPGEARKLARLLVKAADDAETRSLAALAKAANNAKTAS